METLTHKDLVQELFKLLEPELAYGNATEFAEGLGIKQPTFSSYRIGRRIPSLEVCQALANAVDHEVFVALWPKGSKTALDAEVSRGWDRLPENRQAAISQLISRSNDLTDQQFMALQTVWSAFLDTASHE
jgi:transcriptional regulator with XRE-family HTH domain